MEQENSTESQLKKSINVASMLMSNAAEVWQELDKVGIRATTEGGELRPLWDMINDYVEKEVKFRLNELLPVAKKPKLTVEIERFFGGGTTAQTTQYEREAADIEEFPLSDDQEKAWKKIHSWLEDKTPAANYFILKGFAGTGKTHLMKLLSNLDIEKTVYFTAPTNKATKVLGKMLKRTTKTIFSLLSIRMGNETEEKELVWPERMPDLAYGSIIVIDEAGMCNSQLCQFIERARMQFNSKIMYVGDPAQLPPVGETSSLCWEATEDKRYRAMLKEVMRFDNQLLQFATYLRECVRTGNRAVIASNNDGSEGVFKLSEKKFWTSLFEMCHTPKDFVDIKVAAWRNKTVDAYNLRIREHLGLSGNPYTATDQLLLAEPIEIDGNLVATVDEELEVQSVRETTVSVRDYEIPVYELLVSVDEGPTLRLNIPTDDDLLLQTLLSEMADKARRTQDKQGRRDRWKEFWAVKSKFHSVRYAYACTVHRLQGSTLKVTFADFRDIFANREADTANRCAYVVGTRATTALYTF